MNDDPKLPATFFKQEIEQLLVRYRNLTVYETIGALEVVKANLLDRLGRTDSKTDESS